MTNAVYSSKDFNELSQEDASLVAMRLNHDINAAAHRTNNSGTWDVVKIDRESARAAGDDLAKRLSE